ncbi:MAG: hypothetical protein KGH75_03830 [Rhodospirillales bacterium]|nr:hypothetical protein [Rhodospirillales bacterium]
MTISGTTFPMLAIPGPQCMISTSVRQSLPTVRLVIMDPSNVISTALPIVDGTQIGIIMDDTSATNPTPINFRSFGTPKRKPVPNFPSIAAYDINGLLDSIPFTKTNPTGVFTGTSNTAIKNIASLNNLVYSGNVSANDSMPWRPGKSTWAGFVEHISSHSYIDAKSVMVWGVDESKTLHFNNLVPLYNTSPKAYIYYGAPPQTSSNTQITSNNTYPALQYKALNNSGLLNASGGYGQRTVQPTLDGNVSKYLTSNATVTNNSLDINSDLSKAIQPVSRMHLPAADCGNSHPNYIQARHQNHRLKCTYSQNIYVLLYRTTGLNIFDTVNFTASTGDNASTSLVNGTYVVTAKTRCLYSNRYYEKLELTNAGPIVSSNGGLV